MSDAELTSNALGYGLRQAILSQSCTTHLFSNYNYAICGNHAPKIVAKCIDGIRGHIWGGTLKFMVCTDDQHSGHRDS
ncbi:hypothetical protein A9J40_16295 [Stenotrophomonas maltophilia]|nr:hypothetical protein A9J40_16295 [Stenotrophomonas maltophilia]